MKFHARHAYWGGLFQTASVGNFGYVGVNNGNTGPYILRIRWWNLSLASGNLGFGGYLSLSQVTGTAFNPSFGMWSDSPAGGGQPFRAISANQLFSNQIVTSQGIANNWATEIPIAYVQPGQAFAFTSNGANTALTVAFLWEEIPAAWLEPWELE